MKITVKNNNGNNNEENNIEKFHVLSLFLSHVPGSKSIWKSH